MQTIRLALDWTPNINHIGFFVAEDQGFYRDADLHVELRDPSANNYAVTPAKQLETGAVDVALCPTESLISYRTKAQPFPIVAIAALLQEDLSAIAVRADSGIRSPKDLDGKSYASYEARYEDEIVKQLIRNDGGTGDLRLAYPDKLGIWNSLVDGSYDATWVFRNWEGVAAEERGPELRYFNLKDYDIPYSYSPVLATSAATLEAGEATLRKFVEATKKGFLFTQHNPGESEGILERKLAPADSGVSVKKALKHTTPYFGNAHTWGKMDEARLQTFLDWLAKHGLETQPLRASDLYTNALIP
ncbi:ABC-type nitrate/sulfonate/bicarbonate transport system substrate-binding protein [Neolewinella xylanilytica]|uniref:Thiamine pyrimidine synthase n=1 Tax=Neolewinella xylanilytica TaxID=1514080 RepID=A0A2S6IAH9_9BACT|nr:ABC transporter substrate-binding protein [Neolewinella xylanilytica]PPK88498.1 ABC-type nitrate/sulfonate/bicarbonate transport system substrate-binding protein [Neolewinella xylanilytica]